MSKLSDKKAQQIHDAVHQGFTDLRLGLSREGFSAQAIDNLVYSAMLTTCTRAVDAYRAPMRAKPSPS